MSQHVTNTICDWYPAHICLAENCFSYIFCLSSSMKLGPAMFVAHLVDAQDGSQAFSIIDDAQKMDTI